jgi:hypothetical protein
MNNLITKKQDLLDKNGHLSEPGYSVSEVFNYDKRMIKASKWRIKEWDYYCAISKDYAFSFTIADLGYMALITGSLLDFKTCKETKKAKMKFFTFGKLNLPDSADKGNITYQDKGRKFEFINDKDERILKVKIDDFTKDSSLEAELKFQKFPTDDRMLIATPFKENPTRFYYNQKINCMPVSGEVIIGNTKYPFDSENDMGVLDWGRGVWTYKNTWYWGSLSCLVDGVRVGFNIGYGFGDTSKATENVVFYDGKVHKLNNVVFELDVNDFKKQWTFKDDEGRFEMTMTPILDRVDDTNLLIIKNIGHQVFGTFAGYIILDNGKKIEIKDKIGFAEKITNHY